MSIILKYCADLKPTENILLEKKNKNELSSLLKLKN